MLDSAFRIFQVSLLRCLPYGMLSMFAQQLQNVYLLASGKPLQRFGGGDPVWWLLYVVGVLLALVCWSALILRQKSTVSGEPSSIRAELRTALRRLPSIAALFVLVVLGTLIGLLALIVPGIYLSLGFALAWPVLLLEGRGPIQSIIHGVRLVRGHWWRTTQIFGIGLIVVFVYFFVAAMLTALAVPFAAGTDLAVVTALSTVVAVVFGALGAPFMCALVLATFGDLQLRREGTDLERRIAELAQAREG